AASRTLPDYTLAAVVDDLGSVCARAHHADVGGMQPASMPAGATELIQEGVVIPPVELTADVRRVLVANMRKTAERLGDALAAAAGGAAGRPARAGGVHAGRRGAAAGAGRKARPAPAGPGHGRALPLQRAAH